MRTNPLPHYHYAEPVVDKTPAQADQLATHMARNNIYCQVLRCSMSRRQCEHNKESGKVLVCKSCTQEAATAPGFFVDFTGHEDLLQEFTAACASHGFAPGESALDIIYLFVTGRLAQIKETK